jgi:hypothetical protein
LGCKVAGELLWRYLTHREVAWTRYAALRGLWEHAENPCLPAGWWLDVQAEDVVAALDGHPFSEWERRTGLRACRWSENQVRERVKYPIAG